MIEKRHQHYEEKRIGKLDILKKVRAEVVEEEAKGTWNSQNVTLSIILEDKDYDDGWIKNGLWKQCKINPYRKRTQTTWEDQVQTSTNKIIQQK